MIASGIEAVIRTLREHEVRCLLCGGQACVFYGAAEFSKDVDFLLLAGAENFTRMEAAAAALKADVIAVPAFEKRFLDEGLAIHLRCQAPPCDGLRLDVMSRMRGIDDFDALWTRRSSIELGAFRVDLMSVADLITSKKTQRAKDWPMIQRLAEVHYQQHRSQPSASHIDLWLRELRTVELLVEAASAYPEQARLLSGQRPLLRLAGKGKTSELRSALVDEMEAEKERDRTFWEPLKSRLGDLRRAARKD